MIRGHVGQYCNSRYFRRGIPEGAGGVIQLALTNVLYYNFMTITMQ